MKPLPYQMSETFRIAILLALVGGYLDSYTYIIRGGVFANAQTGNIVLLGIHMAEGNWMKAFYYLIPILAFVAGIFVDEWIKKFFLPKQNIHWRQVILMVEIIVLAVVAFVPLGKADIFANVLISFVCSMQVQSFRTVRGLPYASTMCTGNLRSGTEYLFRFSQNKTKANGEKSLKYYGIIFFFICGAALGVWATKALQAYSIFLCCILLLFVFMFLFIPCKDDLI